MAPADIFGPGELPPADAVSPSKNGIYCGPSQLTQRSMARLDVEKKKVDTITGGLNGILLGSGNAPQ